MKDNLPCFRAKLQPRSYPRHLIRFFLFLFPVRSADLLSFTIKAVSQRFINIFNVVVLSRRQCGIRPARAACNTTHNINHNKITVLEGKCMKKTVLALSLLVGLSAAASSYAALPQTVRIGTDATYAPFSSRMRKATSWGLISIWEMRCANAWK